MDSTPGKRLQQWRELKGISLSELARASGIRLTTLSQAESAKGSNPSFDTLTKLLNTYPDLNPDWLMLGTGPMLRDGKALVPAPAKEQPQQVREPAADYTSGAATEQTLYISVLKEQVADLKEDKADLKAEVERLRTENLELRGKSNDSPDAADDLFTPTPTPRNPVGFGKGIQEALLASYGIKKKRVAELS